MKSRLACALLLLIATVLAGCAQATPTPRPPDPTAEASATPAAPATDLLPRDNTPQPDLGIVEGMLTLNGEPAAGRVMYLAAIIRPEGEEGMGVAALDPANDPRVETDATGYFVFLDVEPERYALGILSPGGPVLIQQGGAEIIAEVRAGQVTDLGTVQIVPFAG
jgi:hypothetical protein